jgi:hypothetical protein
MELSQQWSVTLTSGFGRCDNFDILADGVFKYKRVSATNGGDPVHLAEDTVDFTAPSSSATSFEELSPVPIISK